MSTHGGIRELTEVFSIIPFKGSGHCSLPTPWHWGFRLQHMNGGGRGHNIQSLLWPSEFWASSQPAHAEPPPSPEPMTAAKPTLPPSPPQKENCVPKQDITQHGQPLEPPWSPPGVQDLKRHPPGSSDSSVCKRCLHTPS